MSRNISFLKKYADPTRHYDLNDEVGSYLRTGGEYSNGAHAALARDKLSDEVNDMAVNHYSGNVRRSIAVNPHISDAHVNQLAGDKAASVRLGLTGGPNVDRINKDNFLKLIKSDYTMPDMLSKSKIAADHFHEIWSGAYHSDPDDRFTTKYNLCRNPNLTDEHKKFVEAHGTDTLRRALKYRNENN